MIGACAQRALAAVSAALLSVAAAAPGGDNRTTVTVRLTTPVSTSSAKPGDALQAVVTGLPDAGTIVPPGCVLEGRVAEAVTKVRDAGDRARLRLEFDAVRDRAGSRRPLRATVAGVDNARETVEEGAIVGLAPVHARPTGIEALLMLAARAHPMVLMASEAVRLGVKVVERPDIAYGPGVRLTLTVDTVPDPPPLDCDSPPARSRTLDAAETAWVQHLPTRTSAGTPAREADWINVVVLGSATDTAAAFGAAGWTSAERTSLRSDARTFLAVVGRTGYLRGPVALLTLDGVAPSMVFQRQTNTFAKRHHVRLWPAPGVANAWLAAATHDIGLEFSHRTRHYTHRIDGAIDDERSTVLVDLVDARVLRDYTFVERPAVPRTSSNATGDTVTTDGRVLVVTVTAGGGAAALPR